MLLIAVCHKYDNKIEGPKADVLKEALRRFLKKEAKEVGGNRLMVEFKPQKISDVEVGDKVLLQWDGYEGLPKYLSGEWADVVEVKRTRVVVQPGSIVGTQTVRFAQISKVRKKDGGATV